MSAFFYGVALQWKLDLRSKTLLITCYVVPLLFFAMMGGVFTSINPQAKETLIPSMTVMGVTMGALIGLPPSLVEIYGSDSKNMYQANGVPLYLGVISMFLSTFLHLLIMSFIIVVTAPLAFGAAPPANLPLYFGALAIFIPVSLSVGCVLGLLVKSQAKLTMISQLVFLPSMMLSGILFPAGLLPAFFQAVGNLLPASWGYQLLANNRFSYDSLLPLLALFLAASLLCGILLRRLRLKG